VNDYRGNKKLQKSERCRTTYTPVNEHLFFDLKITSKQKSCGTVHEASVFFKRNIRYITETISYQFNSQD
jgi:hypothetical protein